MRARDATRGQGSSGGYQYGYPAAQSEEPNVKFQFLFDESSGNLVDEVSGITCAAVGSPTYRVSASGIWSNLSPGVTYASGVEHRKSTATASLNKGATDHVVWECVATAPTDFTSGVEYLFSYNSDASNVDRGITIYCNGPTTFWVIVRTDDEVQDGNNYTITAINDGKPHKYRVVLEDAANGEAFIDGTSLGTFALTNTSGKTLTNAGIRLGGQFNSGGNNWSGTIYEQRLSIGTDVLSNNSGGPNGG